MSVSPRPQGIDAPTEPGQPQASTLKAATAVLNQFARTLKTCRLYDSNNPAVIRFRDEFAGALRKMLAEHGSLTYRFSSDDVLFDDISLYPARSRDDNFALPFFRDGIRAITFHSGVEPHEVEALLDAVLEVTGQNAGEDDLVTLLWERQLQHIDIDYVPAEGDVGSGASPAESRSDGVMMPWPAGDAAVDEGAGAGEDESPHAESITVGGAGTRSDDWSTGELTVEIEAGFEELDALAPSEVERFRREFEAEHAVPTVTATLAVAYAFLSAGASDDDRAEMAQFLPRILRQAVTHGAWEEATEALRLLNENAGGVWAPDSFAQELLQPISISGIVERIDAQDPERASAFVAFARALGWPAVDLLNLVLAEVQARRARRILAEAIAGMCRDNPERLAPWLSDPRWFVVRNIVHILGWIGGDAIAGMLQSAARHPEPRVRHEVVAALSQVDLKLSRPILLRLLDGADASMFSSVMHQLAAVRDATTARMLTGLLAAPEFDQRPIEEKRALYAALGSAGGDEVLGDLEAELHKGNWFSRHQEEHRQAVARVIARIGTERAREVLAAGAQSRRAPVRKACEDALNGLDAHD
jgi:HEAT repeat protein